MSPKPIAGKRRTKAEVEEIKNAALEEAYKEFRATGTGASLRRIHYRLYARHDTTYRNTENDYKSLSKWLGGLRLEGDLPWRWISDATRDATEWAMWSNLGDYLDGVEQGYGRDVWQDQPRYVEVWVEKDALSVHFKGVLQKYGVTLNVGRGFSSWSAVKETADRYRRIDEVAGKDITLLAFSDFDASGEDMIRDLRERLGHPLLPGGGVHPEM